MTIHLRSTVVLCVLAPLACLALAGCAEDRRGSASSADAASGLTAQPSATSGSPSTSGAGCESETDEAAIRALVRDRIAEAWVTGDADTMAALFTPDADLVVGDGTHLTGREEIAAYMTEGFAGFLKGARTEGETKSVRCIAPGVAVAHTVAGLLLAGQQELLPEQVGLQVYVLRKGTDGQWLTAAYQNTRIGVAEEADEQDPASLLESLREVTGEIDAAWNRGDTAGFAAHWTQDATLVSPMGERSNGRSGIEQRIAAGLAGEQGGTRHRMTVERAVLTAPGVAVADGHTEVSAGDEARTSGFTAVFVQVAGGPWQVAHLRPTGPAVAEDEE